MDVESCSAFWFCSFPSDWRSWVSKVHCSVYVIDLHLTKENVHAWVVYNLLLLRAGLLLFWNDINQHFLQCRLVKSEKSEGEHRSNRVWHQDIDAFSICCRGSVNVCVCVFLVVPGNRTSYLPEREGLSPGRRPWSWMTGSPRLDRETVLQFFHHLTHTPMQEKGSEDMRLCVFMVMGHCLHYIHFPLSAGWFPFRNTEQKRKMHTLN